MSDKTRCLFTGSGGPYMCTEADIDFWNSLNPSRQDELKLVEILQGDRSRDLRQAMKEATHA